MHDPELRLVTPHPDVSRLVAARWELVLLREPEVLSVKRRGCLNVARVQDGKRSQHVDEDTAKPCVTLEREPRAHDKQRLMKTANRPKSSRPAQTRRTPDRKVVLRRFQDDPEIPPILDVSLGSKYQPRRYSEQSGRSPRLR